MSYRVVKWIDGKPYLYEQTSYREGGKVKTKCRYIGTAGGQGQGGGITTSADQPVASELKEIGKSTRKQVGETVNATLAEGKAPETGEPAAGIPVPAPPRTNTTNINKNPRETAQPQIRIKIKPENHAISETALLAERVKTLNRLQHLKTDTSKFADIELRYGGETRYRRKRNGTYTVTLPKRRKGTRTKFKRAYSKALAQASLDLLAEQKPDHYDRVALAFDKSYRATTQAVSTYIRHTKDRNKLVKALIFRLWGKYLQIHYSKLKPHHIGLADDDRRKHWRDEAAALIADVHRQGWDKTQKERKGAVSTALQEEKRAINAYRSLFMLSPRRWVAKRRLKRALARVQATKEMVNKLNTLNSLFCWH